MDNKTLSSCPFCGGNPEVLYVVSKNRYALCYEIRCNECGNRTDHYDDEPLVINAWNRRVGDEK